MGQREKKMQVLNLNLLSKMKPQKVVCLDLNKCYINKSRLRVVNKRKLFFIPEIDLSRSLAWC